MFGLICAKGRFWPSVAGSVPEPVPHLHRHHSRIVYVRASESISEVDEVPSVHQVGSGHFGRPVLAERLSDREIDGAIAGKMLGAIAVQESRTVAEARGYPTAPWEVAHGTHAQSVSLIVVEEEQSMLRWSEVRQPAGDATLAFRKLM